MRGVMSLTPFLRLCVCVMCAVDTDVAMAQALPATLNAVPFLQFGEHAHLQGLFKIPSAAALIPFTLRQPSALRVFLQPHIVDIDLYLYNDTAGEHVIIARSVNYYAEDSIAAVLPAGDYSLRIAVLTPWMVGVRSFVGEDLCIRAPSLRCDLTLL